MSYSTNYIYYYQLVYTYKNQYSACYDHSFQITIIKQAIGILTISNIVYNTLQLFCKKVIRNIEKEYNIFIKLRCKCIRHSIAISQWQGMKCVQCPHSFRNRYSRITFL